MALQEFIASFAADVDESSVNRLEQVLKETKSLAEALASAFVSAKSALADFATEAANVELPWDQLLSSVGGETSDALTGAIESFDGEVKLPVTLDLKAANQELKKFKSPENTLVRLTGDASGVVSAANTALASIKATYSGTTLSINAKIDAPAGNTGSAGAGGAANAGATSGGSGLMRSSIGGRFTRSTVTEVAEDGQPEYIIPIQKEPIAVPLIRQMLSELSESAKESVRPAMEEKSSTKEVSVPSMASIAKSEENSSTNAAAAPAAVPAKEEIKLDIASLMPARTEENSVPGPAPAPAKEDIKLDIASLLPARAEESSISNPEPVPAKEDIKLDISSLVPEKKDESIQKASVPTFSSLVSANEEAKTPNVNALSLRESILSSVDSLLSSREVKAPTLASLPSSLAAASASSGGGSVPRANVSAPVNITINPASAQPEAIGQSVYNLAERYLLKTLKGVTA